MSMIWGVPSETRSTSGFSNQQALLALLLIFPIGLMGLGLVITFAMRSGTTTATQPSTPQSAPAPPATPVPQPIAEVPSAQTTTQPKPLANASTRSTGSTCWFQMQQGGSLVGDRCSVNARINTNGDRVFDVIEPSGLKRSVVLWDNNSVEVFLDGQRYTGEWTVDDDGDVRVSLPGGTFAFTPPA